jgi:hypothetical protein
MKSLVLALTIGLVAIGASITASAQSVSFQGLSFLPGGNSDS